MPFPYNSRTYKEFFEEIAVQHTGLLHNKDRDANEVSFGEIYLSSDPYEGIDVRTFLQDKKSKIKYPLLLLIGADWDLAGTNQNNTMVNGGFIVLDKVGKDGVLADERLNAIERCETIAQDIMGFVVEYFRANAQYGTLKLDTVKGEYIGPLSDGVHGFKVTFSYLNRYTNFCFNQNKFLVLTPAADVLPDPCNDEPLPEYCDLFLGKLSAQQRNCLRFTLIDGGVVGEPLEDAIGIMDGGTV